MRRTWTAGVVHAPDEGGDTIVAISGSNRDVVVVTAAGSDAIRLPPGPGRVDALVMRAFYRRLWDAFADGTPGVMGE